MDSRTGFASLLIIVGLVGVWALFTGKIQKWAPGLFSGSAAPAAADTTAPAKGGAASDAGQAGSGSAGGWSPAKTSGAPKGMAINSISLPLGQINGAAKYQIAIGSDGAKIMPIGDPIGSPTIMQPSGRG